MHSSEEWAIMAAQAASDKRATDIVAINVAELLVVTDYFVIATGNTDIQVRAIADEIEDRLREEGGIKPVGREGVSEGKWVLLDFGDLVAHIFQPQERDFYRLERLWSDAPRLALPADVSGQIVERKVAEETVADSDESAADTEQTSSDAGADS